MNRLPRLARAGRRAAAVVLAACALRASAATETLVADGATWRYRIPTDGTLALTWTQADGFDDSAWSSGPSGIGFETPPSVFTSGGLIRTVLPISTGTSCYMRCRFVVTNLSGFVTLTLRMKFDDGFVAYLNGTKVASENVPDSPQWNSTATATHPTELAVADAVYNLSGQIGLLREGTNVLAIQSMNMTSAIRTTDMLSLPVLEMGTYSAPVAPGVVINEVHYNPDSEIEFVEFIELLNAGSAPVNIGGWYFSSGVSYTFPSNLTLNPGSYAVVAESPASFSNKFHKVCLGPYDGRLSSEGEKLTLRSAAGVKMDEISYGVGFPWPTCGDAPGYSMQLIHAGLDNDLGGSWRSATPTPGASNAVSLVAYRIPPAIRQVAHAPVVPTNGQPIVVTAKITDLDGVSAVSLAYQVVQPGNYIPAYLPLDHAVLLTNATLPRAVNPAFTNAAAWTNVTMRDDGLGGDAKAGDSIYTVTLPGQGNRTLVRYRIAAADQLGNPVSVPYADDAGLNFACYVYNGVPPYQPLKATVHPDGLGHVYGTNTLMSLPVYSLLTRSADLTECIAYNTAYQIPKGNAGRSVENWEGAFVYDGVVYDHVNYRLRQANGRYGGTGKRSMHINFNRGRYLEARDQSGKKFPRAWKTLMTSKMLGNRGVGDYGMYEVMDFALWRLVGVPAPQTVWFHFRVVDGADEVPAGTTGQYYGDFWGLGLALENYDGAFEDNHGLEDGNLYKLTDEGPQVKGEQRVQGRYSVTNAEDYTLIRNSLNATQSETWLRTYVNYPQWYRFHTVAEAVRHYDFWVGCNKNMGWYFEPMTSNVYGRLMFLPYDCDDTWGPYWNAGVDEAKAAIMNSPTKPNLKQEYRNYIREFCDLVWQPEVINSMLDDTARTIADFLPADRDRWKDAPADAGNGDFGTLDAKLADMRNFAWVGGLWAGDSGPVTGRVYVLNALANEEGDDAALPVTPSIAAVGPTGFPANALLFQSGVFADPQGSNTFAAMKWRVGEITDPGAPAYDATQLRMYEVPAVWESGDLSNFTAQASVPASAVKVGHTYRVRVCHKDDTGRWSHWSAPVQFTAGDSSASLQLANCLRISELMACPQGGSSNEFIELHNTSPTDALDLNGVQLTDGVTFAFPAGTVLPPLGYLVVTGSDATNNFATFRARYGLSASVPVAGPWSGALNDGGETIEIQTAAGGSVILSCEYGNGRDWPLAAGAGHSLIPLDLTDPLGDTLKWGGNWRASAYLGGSPGRADPEPVRDVFINEFMAHTDYTNPALPEYDSDDWIELYNATPAEVPIGGWFLSDDAGDLRKWAIPATNVLAAQGWAVFDEVSGFHFPITNGFGMSKYGEAIYLSNLGGTTNDRIVDCLRYEGQENGVSEGRFPDGATPGYAMPATPGAANRLGGSHVVISELMVHPAPTAANPENNTNDEYIELYNATDTSVELMSEGGAWRLNGAVSYTFPDHTTMGPRETLLLVSFSATNAAARSAFLAAYGLTNGQARLLGPYSGSLPNHGGRVAVERAVLPDLPGDPYGWFIVDEVIYGTAAPWPSSQGVALRRVRFSASGNASDNWAAESMPTPGGQGPRAALDTPSDGAAYLVPFTVPLGALVDSNQVDSGAARVEFLEGDEVIGVATNPPFVFEASGAEVREYRFAARLVDGSGTYVSPARVVQGLGIDNATGATAVAESSATLNGTLTGSGTAQVTVYWGEGDGGTDALAWAHSAYLGALGSGPFSAAADGLLLGRRYFYRCHAQTAGNDGWAPSSESFSPPMDAWLHRERIRFGGYTRATPLTNFPALVALGTNIAGFSYEQFASPEGGDLRFLDASRTTALPYEVETWDTNGESLVWVQVPLLASPTDSVWACWGNAAATNPPEYTRSGETWSEGYRAVWHLNGSTRDSTVNHTVAADHATADAPGAVARGRTFDGAAALDPILDSDWYYDNMSNLTVSLWAKPAAAGDGPTVFGSVTAEEGKPFHVCQAGDSWRFAADSLGSPNTEHGVDVGQWQHLGLVMSGGGAYAFKNGTPPGSPIPYATFGPAAAPWVGTLNGSTNDGVGFVGELDEVRISDVARSPDWIWAEYMTVASNTVFTTYPRVVDAQTEDLNDDGVPEAWQALFFPAGGPDTLPDEDADGDGVPNRDEYVAATDPTNSASFLHIEGMTFLPPVVSVNFLSAAGRLYGLETCEDLGSNTWAGSQGGNDLPGDGAPMWLSDTNAARATFFRLRVHLP